VSEEQLIRLPLTPDARKRLDREHKGRGGFESLLRRLHQQIVEDGHAVMASPKDLEQLLRYSTAYGPGGFEDRLRPTARVKKR
jgi:hypothetical protein